ncbi:MAG: hypothetical protein K9J37_12970 [Saprospiraceae bacterium]|nr:hypothetical protein [Saprospiraceae bacterium]MCF8250820.1 hypothetical protein [Saprospiraceae bacterium]MCF8281435.1 hypothetical protein [Bacteroidales bacterium]MCF8312621.1 hypothetical protein [Saprospiraceae bacterium]MCF8441011.1 hypothetical protein [Saprospiraceae bacterium]
MSAYNYLSRKGVSVAFLAVVVVFLIAIIPIVTGLSDFSDIPTERQAFSPEGGIFKTGIYLAIGLLILAVLTTLVLSLLQIFSNFKAAKKGLIAFGGLVVLFGIIFAMTDANVGGALGTTVENFKVSDTIFKVISGGIQLSLMMLVGIVVIVVLMEIWGYFKNQ